MKVIFSKYIPFLLIAFGALFMSWNANAFLKGYLSQEEAKISGEAFSSTQASLMNKQIAKKEVILYKAKPKSGEKLGELTIPSLNQAFPIYEGTTKEVLKKGVGHLRESALPGEKDNSIISGHRDTVFRGLGKLRPHDELIVTTEAGSFLYKIKKTQIVDQNDRTIMTPKPKATLTITTCYPFYFLGNAPQRYIITAELISSKRS